MHMYPFKKNTFMVQTSGTHTDFLHPDNQTTTHAHILLHVIVHNFLFHNHRTGLTFGLTQTVGGICLCPITTAWTVTHPRSVPAIHDDEQNWPAFPTLQGLRWFACSSCQTHGYKGLYNFQKDYESSQHQSNIKRLHHVKGLSCHAQT